MNTPPSVFGGAMDFCNGGEPSSYESPVWISDGKPGYQVMELARRLEITETVNSTASVSVNGPRTMSLSGKVFATVVEVGGDKYPREFSRRDKKEDKVARGALVWIRRDLYISRRFAAADCFPARWSERAPYTKKFSFARDWWSLREGGKEICAQILKMAPAGRGGGRKSVGRRSSSEKEGNLGGLPPNRAAGAPNMLLMNP
jgi:hypothetical protein